MNALEKTQLQKYRQDHAQLNLKETLQVLMEHTVCIELLENKTKSNQQPHQLDLK